MKSIFIIPSNSHASVAPYTGAWIEIADIYATDVGTKVAPYTGAWIEIMGKVL